VEVVVIDRVEKPSENYCLRTIIGPAPLMVFSSTWIGMLTRRQDSYYM
jgi:hypothetical protein